MSIRLSVPTKKYDAFLRMLRRYMTGIGSFKKELSYQDVSWDGVKRQEDNCIVALSLDRRLERHEKKDKLEILDSIFGAVNKVLYEGLGKHSDRAMRLLGTSQETPSGFPTENNANVQRIYKSYKAAKNYIRRLK